SFTLEYMQDGDFDVPTEIFVPGKISVLELPEGAAAETEENDNCTILKIKSQVGKNRIKVSW
ncbi:MAG TPA: hypothetical protein PLD98_08885, partial [Clostridiales bacterium]|nr:hypothetical protein [Clostridiales bacterium]